MTASTMIEDGHALLATLEEHLAGVTRLKAALERKIAIMKADRLHHALASALLAPDEENHERY